MSPPPPLWTVPADMTRAGQWPAPVDERQRISYGTAGFRAHASGLQYVMHRVGAMAAVLSRHRGASAVGVMVTASHNAQCDNGVKVVEPSGDMMHHCWERTADAIANATDADLVPLLRSVDAGGPEAAAGTGGGTVLIGRDTRPTSRRFAHAVRTGASGTAGATVYDFGVCTTPQLHFMVRCWNDASYGNVDVPLEHMRTDTMHVYYDKLAHSYIALNRGVARPPGASAPLQVDCANGVGAPALRRLAGLDAIANSRAPLNVALHNCHTGDGSGDNGDCGGDALATEGILNNMCGADYVKQGRRAPTIYTVVGSGTAASVPQYCGNTASAQPMCGQRWATLDGDADRIVYFYIDETAGFRLLDGDKIAVLLTVALLRLAHDAGVAFNNTPAVTDGHNGHSGSAPMSLGVVQTAYANGASTDYIRRQLGVSVALVPTGVKHLHKAAGQYDAGVYFEANGHGTAVFSDKFKRHIRTLGDEADKLRHFVSLVNETVGDALADLLCIESALALMQWDERKWDSLYEDVPSVMSKVQVADRCAITTTWDETECLTPKQIQADIDRIVHNVPLARAFVRPSGTEDIVRIYAEAHTLEAAKSIAAEIGESVKLYCH